jgi:hypothetical protein
LIERKVSICRTCLAEDGVSNSRAVERTLEQAERAMPVRLIATFDGLTPTTPEARVSQALGLANEVGSTISPFDKCTDHLSVFLTDLHSKVKIS